ncbi:MAG: endopeptidase La [Oscillospiraceae bacterium]|nr:endopeptidase La [Oscillospiraceae bacterium]MCL2277843.1 endopeptidase La [Oscillospiraceae bacterium]
MDELEHKITEFLPLLALRGLSVFPTMLLNFDVERVISTGALDAASAGDRRIFLLAQKDMLKDTPSQSDLHRVGTICYIKQVLKIPGGGMKVLVEGKCRAQLVALQEEKKYFTAEVLPYPEVASPKRTSRVEALMRKATNLFDSYCALSQSVSRETLLHIFMITDPGRLSDFIIQNIFTKPEKKQLILDTIDPVKRLEIVCDILAREIEVLTIERQIDSKLREKLESNHRDHILREQLRVIQSELGDSGGDEHSEFETYRKKILALKLDEEVSKKILKEVDKLEKQSFGSAEASVIRNYLDVCIELPWNKTTKERLDIIKAREILDNDHFGLDKVKDRIIEFLAVRQLSPKIKGAIICLVGPPGVGKTSVAISVAKALNRKLCRIALGGVHDESEIRGHRKTYIGAMPGRIITALKQAGSSNPLMLLDEIDKLGRDHRGDPASALLEALDPEQNTTFRDNFMEIPYDLSNVMFVTTANTTDSIARPLLDRMEVIELTSYTDVEKLEIAKRYIIPKQRKKHGLKASQLNFTDDAIYDIISSYTKESGVRILEREVAAVCRKTAAKIAAGEAKSVKLSLSVLDEFLGVRKYKPESVAHGFEIGIANGLAWTTTGGCVLEVEVNVLSGKGNLELTGNLGDVMKESAQAAVSFIRSRADKLGIPEDFYSKNDIHIHFPEGAIPKDGPSAGITMCMAVISALTSAPARRDVAMTGEISLRGRILKIGGLKEKTMAALRAGVKTVIIPAENEADLDEIDQTVRSKLNFITTDNIDDVLDVVLDFSSVDRKAGAKNTPHMLKNSDRSLSSESLIKH